MSQKELLFEIDPNNRAYFPGKPIVLGAAESVLDNRNIYWFRDGQGHPALTLPSGKIVHLRDHDVLNHIDHAFNAINANLQPGTRFEEYVSSEWNKYQGAVEEARANNSPHQLRYGDITYYPTYDKVVWQAPRAIRGLSLIARNDFLLQDPQGIVTYETQREIFGSQVVGVFGASVASLAAIRAVQTLKPGSIDLLDKNESEKGGIKIADFDVYDHAVQGRRRHGLLDIGRNKAIVTAEDLLAHDPTLPIWVYTGGVDPFSEEGTQFILGNTRYGEPQITQAIEAIDNIEEKLKVLRLLKEHRIRTWRITDIGVASEVILYAWDKDPDIPIAKGLSDDDLQAQLLQAQNNNSRTDWMRFALSITGPNWRDVPEFAQYIDEVVRSPFSRSIPQLGIAAEQAASHVALGIASTLLGHPWSRRKFVDARANSFVVED